MSINFILSFAITLSLTSFADGPRCGSDGPKPFHDLSGYFLGMPKPIKTVGTVKEFYYSHKLKRIIYRNDSDQLRGLIPFTSNDLFFTRSTIPISRVSNYNGQKMVTENSRWYFNVGTPQSWLPISANSSSMKPLFWKGKFLYSMALDQSNGLTQYRFYRYRGGSSHAKEVCVVNSHSQDFRLGEGHSERDVVFYESKPVAKGFSVDIYSLDLKRCKLEHSLFYKDPFPGPITRLVRFPDLDSIAIELDHSLMSLFWDTPKGCRYYDIENAKTIFPTTEAPLMLTWSEATGVKVIHLENRQIVRILDPGDVGEFGEKHAWISHESGKLLLAPQLGLKGQRVILEFKLPGFLP